MEHSPRVSFNIIKDVVIWDPILRLTRNITGCYCKTRSKRFILAMTTLHAQNAGALGEVRYVTVTP